MSGTPHLPLLTESRSAAFGPRVTQAPGLLGYVLPLSSFTYPCPSNSTMLPVDDDGPENWGCPELCVIDDSRKPDKETWIALVQRGDCSFVDKVREAMRFGARGVVVGGGARNPEGGDDLVTMYSTGELL